MTNKIIIIDGNSLINRAYYAMQRPMITKDGIYTQGIYGFINMLTRIEKDYEPTHIVVTFDLKGATFRHLEYQDYKAGRKPMPPELAMQIPLLKDVLGAMNIKTMEMEGFEADDLIGTVSRLAEEEGLEPFIVTGDKDALQLASEKTKVIITKRGVTDFDLYDYKKMVERYSLTPTQFIDLKGLMGDSSDNIPGIPGIGEKTGIALLKEFGSIENLIENRSKISKAGVRKKVDDNIQLAIMSKKLATINRFVPLDVDFEDLRFTEPDYERLIALYNKLDFKSFLKKLDLDDRKEEMTFSPKKFAEKDIVARKEELKKLTAFKKEKEVFLKVFSDYSHVHEPELWGITIIGKNRALLFDLNELTVEEVMEELNSLNLSIYGHNLQRDLFVLMYYGFKEFHITYDTAIGEYLLNSTRRNYELKDLALEKLKTAIPTEEEFLSGKTQIDMFREIASDYLEYGMLIGSCVEKIKEIQSVEIKENKLEEVFYQVEIPLIEAMASMEVTGIHVDKEYIDQFGIELMKEIRLLEKEIYELAGERFNINSPQQLGKILFEKLELPSWKKTKTGYSTSADILKKLRDKHPIISAVLNYRNLTKLNSTYVEGLKPLISNDEKIRAHFQQTVTATGRLSCTEPNLQNIPIRSELGRKLRKAFTAGKGCTLVGADYSQIELRILAHLSEDETLIESFNKGEDIHSITASRVFDIPEEQVTALDRSRAKAVNFGVIYGMSGFGLSEELNITRKEAETYISQYFEKHIKVKEYMDNQIAQCKEKGYAETILGRKRYINEINASQYNVRQSGERLAMNTPIQGSAADVIKLAMVKVYTALKENHPKSKLILQVHDELIIDADNCEIESIKRLLVENMEDAMKMSVKLLAEVNQGFSWYDLK